MKNLSNEKRAPKVTLPEVTFIQTEVDGKIYLSSQGTILIAPTTTRIRKGGKKEKIVLLSINFMGGSDLMETNPIYSKLLNETAVEKLRVAVKNHTDKRFVVYNSELVDLSPEKTVQVDLGERTEPLKLYPEYLIEIEVSRASAKTLWDAGFQSFSKKELEKYVKIPRSSRKDMLLKMME